MKHLILIFLLALVADAAMAQPADSKPFDLGMINEISSGILSEKRTLNIYLPEGYNAKDTTRYPVIYLLDGAADEDFIHIVGLVYFNTFPWVNRMPKSIIVGIANTDRRRDDFFPSSLESDKKLAPTSGGLGKFISFIKNELQPFIDKTYKTNDDRTIIGQSAGGLLATEILFTQPTLFNKYIIVSPSLWWDNASILKRSPAILRPDFTAKLDVYIGVGKEGLAPTSGDHVMEVDANVLADKLAGSKSKSLKVYFDYMPSENHATSLQPAVINAFKWLYQSNTGMH